jgi:hypothetical protein
MRWTKGRRLPAATMIRVLTMSMPVIHPVTECRLDTRVHLDETKLAIFEELESAPRHGSQT